MEYLLKKEEFDNLVSKDEVEKRDNALQWAFDQLKPESCGNENYCGFCRLSSLSYNDDQLPPWEVSNLICRKRKSYAK